MNPTEKFCNNLREMIEEHEKETGLYIHLIKIERVIIKTGVELRAEYLISGISIDAH